MRRRNIHHPPIEDDVHVQTAFYALMELNRKLAWAEWMGFPAPTTTSTKSTSIKFKEVGDEEYRPPKECIPCQQSDLAMMRYCHQSNHTRDKLVPRLQVVIVADEDGNLVPP
jgi:hypothetical protein